MDVLAQASSILTSYNTEVMAKLTQFTVTMGEMQAQMKKMITKQTRNFYCWSHGRNFKNVIHICRNKKAGSKNDTHYMNRLGGRNKVCE